MFEKLIARFAKLIHSPIGLTGTAARTKRRPTGAALRNPAYPIQAARIEAAAVKRARRADKLYRDARYSGSQNYSLSHLQIK